MTLDVATALFTAGRTEEALAHCKQHLSQQPGDPAAWDVLGAMLHNLGQYRPAIEALRRSLQLKPDEPHVLGHLAAALKGAGDLPAAETVAQKALQLRPDNDEVLNSYGNLLNDMHRSFEAEEVFRKAIAANPSKGMPYGNLAYTMFLLGRNSEGEVYARRGLQVEPDSANLQNSLGSAVMGQDRLVEAATYFRKAVELDPAFTVAHSNLLFCRNYDPEASAEDIFEDYRGWDDLHGRPPVPANPTFENDRNPDRRIRLGLVSPDFRRHAANYFLEPLLEAHDRQEVELFLYGMVPAPDKYTERYRALAAGWRNVIGIGDDEMAAQIREDRIDILVDLAGHTARNRLKVFARRPAPVMVAYLVGLGYTTGMSVFDGFFADDAMAPPDAAHLFSEPVLRLSRFPMVYRPPQEMPEVGPLPAATAGHVTFGSFSRTVRINARVVRTWARILQAVPDARLMLNTKAFAEEETRQTYRDMFAREGIDPGRLQLVFTQPQAVTWATYGKVDIALDPFPHNAGTTTFEALWMGVPVITRMDRPSVGRFGASILHGLGHPEWVAADDEDYLRRAVTLAADIDALAKLRSGMRDAMRRSPLMDSAGLAREVEWHYRRLWRGWCTGHTEAQPQVQADPSLLYRHPRAAGSLSGSPSVSEEEQQGAVSQASPGHRQVAIECLHAAGRHREALAQAARLSAENPGDVQLLGLVAKAFLALGRRGEAEAVLRQARALADGDEAALRQVGDLRAAAPVAGPGGAPTPADSTEKRDDPAACRQRAERAHAQGQLDLAEAWYRRFLALQPDDASAANNLAAILLDTGRPAEAQDFAEIAARQAPDSPQVIGNLAMALCEQADLANGLPLLQKLVDDNRATARIHANLLFAQNYDPHRDAATIRRTAEGWASRHASPGDADGPGPAPVPVPPGGRLRIGYVSPDFRIHATLNFLLPLLQAHDRDGVEVHLYAEVPVPDAASALYRQAADRWHDTFGRSDDEVLAQIRQDGIDVLVDLAGHTSSARLGLFARRAAPVQLTYPLGFGASTGLRQFDGVIADASLAPAGSEADFTEPVQRLDGAWSAFRPQSPFPNVGPLPADRQGHVTFGCFSRTIRLNDRVLDAWAAILQAVPHSRLLLNNRAFQEPRVRARFAEGFRRRQVAPDRLDMVYVSPQGASLSHYGQVDITLDPFPHSAATTVAESLWMGVPVVTLRGPTPVGRLGAALLDAAGLEAWAAPDLAGYCDVAARLAADPDRLRAARAGLRQHLEDSPFTDHRALAGRLEALYRRLSGSGGATPGPRGSDGSPAKTPGTGAVPPPGTAPQAGSERTAGAEEAVRRAAAMLHAGNAARALELLRPLADAETPAESALFLLLVALVNSKADAAQGLPFADQLVALAPGQAGYHNIRGILLRRSGRRADAEAALRRAMALSAAPGEADFNLNYILMEDKRYRESEELMAAFCARAPDRANAWIALGQARQMQMHTRGAIEAYKRGLALSPDDYEGWSNLCPMHVVLEEFDAAVEAGKRAIALNSGQKKDLINMAVAEYRLYNLKESEKYCRQIIEMAPQYPLVWNNLANIYLNEARFDEAFGAYRRALECDPGGFQHNSNLLFALNYAPDMTAEEIFAEYRQWDQRHARPLVPADVRHDNDRDPARRLRLGYASPDFRSHAAQNFLFPMLEGHDRGVVELVLYSECPAPDDVTERYRALADGWCETYDLPDDALADRIRRDGIDIMIDLASHTANNRLRAMVRRPAPITVSLLVGLGYTTGISGIDYFVGDGDMTPPEAAHLFGETLIRLGRFPMAYRAREGMFQVNALPALERGHVTFGSLSRTMRLNRHVIAAWARILQAVPGSRLILNNKPYQDPAVRDLFMSRFVAHGIDPARLRIFRGGVDYRDIDIALDPWPHNAGTTTCEALWAGVPVLSKRDRPSVGRFGASILRALQMADWVADDVDSYVARAVAAAGDLGRLADLRAGLRQRMAASPLCDGRDLATQMEAAFRAAWQRWCRGEGPAPITIQADGTPRIG